MKLRTRFYALTVALTLTILGIGTAGVVAAPAPPVPSSPANDGSVTSLRPTISWQASAGATTYAAELADNAAFNGRIQSGWIGATSFAPSFDLNLNSIYYWRVKATDPSSSSDYSAVWHFWTPLTLVSPTSGSSTTLTPTLSWSQYKTGVDSSTRSYRIQIASDSGFGSVVHDQTLNGVAWGSNSYAVPAGVLSLGSTYYWRVKAINSDGQSAWSEAWSFSPPPNAPPAPVLTSPANGSTTDTWVPALTWGQVATASSYKLYYSKDGGATTVKTFSTAPLPTSFSLDTYGAEGSTYEWWVEAINVTGTSPSAHWTFITPGPTQPSVPALSTPTNGAVISSLTPTFDWSDTTYTKSYRIDVGTGKTQYGVTGLLAGVANLTQSTYNYAPDGAAAWPLNYNTTYYWQVSAFTVRSVYKTTSEIWQFRTPAPPGPTLSLPANGVTVDTRRPSLSWGAAAGATTYQIQVARDGAFTAPLVVDSSQNESAGTSFTLQSDLDYDSLYFWRVRFTDSTGTSNWSEAWSFRGPPPPIPFAPALVSPGAASGAPQIVGFRPAFSWNASTSASSYGFQLARDSGFTNLVAGANASGLTATSFSLSADLSPSSQYFWHVNASNDTGTSDWSTVFSFTTPPPPPVAPTLLSPINGATITVLRPHYDWSDVAGATAYTIEVYQESYMSTLVSSNAATTSEFDSTVDLVPDTIYWWRVRSASDASGAGPWTSVTSFKTPPVPAPAKPALVTPANLSTIDTLVPTLDWQDDPNSGAYAIQYHVQLAKNNGFTGTLAANSTISTSSYTQPTWGALDKNTVYYWRVQGINGSVTGEWSDVLSFTTPNIPGTPTLASPADGTAVTSTTPTLSVTPMAGVTSYIVLVSTASWFPASAMTITSATPDAVPATALSYDTLYYWKAQVKNAAGTSGWSEVRTFRTPLAPPAPEAPTLLSPANGYQKAGARPTLDWSDVTGATKYRVEWSKSATFAWTEASRDNLTLSTFTLDVDLLYNTQYYWRVKATGEGGDSAYSAIFGFKTASGPPSLPGLLAPSNGSALDSSQYKLDWTDADATDSYQVQISTNDAFSGTLVADTGVTVSEFTPGTPLPSNATYYWRVKSKSGIGESDWTAPWSFTIPAPPAAVTLLTPTNGFTVDSLKPSLDWSDADRAGKYKVRYARTANFGDWVTPVDAGTSTMSFTTALIKDSEYSWQVQAVNGGGDGPWSAVWTFRTPLNAPDAPGAPNLLTPVDGAALTDVLPVFSWQESQYANGYRVQTSKDPSFATFASNDYVTGLSHTTTVPLEYSTTYYWRVVAVNTLGSTDSVTRTFTTPPAPAPAVPTLVAPADQSTTAELAVVFDWSDSPTATGYRIQVSTGQEFSSFVVNTTVQNTSTYTVPTWIHLDYNTKYYWRVQAYNNAGSSVWQTAPFTFTTPAQPPTPPAPTLAGPGGPDDVTPVIFDNLKPEFTWENLPTATSYRFQLSGNSAFSGSLRVNATTTAPSYSMGWSSLAVGTQYWWRVQASNSNGVGEWSAVYSFKTPSVPVAPVLSSPANTGAVTETKPALSWSTVDGATSYHIQVGTNAWFGTKVADADVPAGTSYTLATDLTSGKSYYWKVLAKNAAGSSAYSQTWSFTVSSTPVTPTPGPTSGVPANLKPGAQDGGTVPTINTLDPVYSWDAPAEGATSYKIQVAKDSAFSVGLATNTVTAPSYTPPSWVHLSSNTQYWWRVQAIDGSVTGSWAPTFTFKTVGPPAVPTLLTPANSETVANGTPALDWQDVDTASSYHIQIGTNSWFGTKVVDADVTTGSTYTPTSALTPGTYYWKVLTKNAAGSSLYSETRSFAVPAGPVTPTPTPTGLPIPSEPGVAAGGTAPVYDTLNPTWKWTGVDGATSYRIQISKNEGFTSLLTNTTNGGETTYNLPSWMHLTANTQYWWRIQATTAAGAGGWSQAFTFRTPAIPGAPSGPSPADTATGVGTGPALSWGAVDGASSYNIQLSTTPWFGSKLVDAVVTSGNSYSTSGLTAGKVYYWKVRSGNASGYGAWSSTWSFTP